MAFARSGGMLLEPGGEVDLAVEPLEPVEVASVVAFPGGTALREGLKVGELGIEAGEAGVVASDGVEC